MFSQSPQSVPLASRMAPQDFDQYQGQNHIIPTIRMMVEKNSVRSMVFYGPPASGKTGLASIIAQSIHAEFISVNALTLSGEDIRSIHKQAELNSGFQKQTVLFIDEIHRLTKPKQDSFLASVESGLIILIGATTENPYFSLQPALRSRLLIFEFFPLEKNMLQTILHHALTTDSLLQELNVAIEPDAENFLLKVSSDPRKMLTIFEATVLTKGLGNYLISQSDIETIISQSDSTYNKEDMHYNVISAFIKSIRGSDPDAALHYLATMLYSGEDPRFIFRRLMISAVEDVGLAYPNAIDTIVACAEAFEKVGFPEGNFFLSHATIFLAGLPKSNSNLAIYDALDNIKKGNQGSVPSHLQDSHSASSKILGKGKNYLYPHDFDEHFVLQDYMEQKVSYYKPSEQGFEKKIKDRLSKLWKNRFN